MSAIEYHVVIACPLYWAETTARTLADRLLADELPEAVGVYVWKLEDGKLVEQTALRTQEDSEGYRV